ncbi:tripartite tricarboxylate transporter TctB family protein [Teichococcus vastitatis]|uniref:Tripartite tricarboxylate transporter TctB family protein n=1 Tax=Teichococcus vastitatis TaxID=2307076 RepID=A0ABS9W014_9PROT|nr:tripartite tricarboxylate transporter TctB family protein [Pseudoroseomonas vastitatis]MCI0752518.1 tripartite tricarboxylate transporter TctB family protein [Pseudoroseomonas vastitatis]
MNGERPGAMPDLVVGVFVVLLGLLCLWQAWAIPVTPLYAQVGPKFMPYVVGTLVCAVGIGLVGVALRGGWSHTIEEVEHLPPTNWRALGLLGAGLVANLVLIGTLGFVFAATAQFVLVAASFGSRHPIRDLAIGIAVSLGAYLAFDKLLGVNIGAGILEGIL